MKDAAALLNLDRLLEYLRDKLEGVSGKPEIHQFGGGASNLTFLLSFPKRELIVRRPPPGRKAAGAHDMGREARILSGLKPQFPKVPDVYLYCDDESVMGAPFFVMERLDGVILRGDLPDGVSLEEQDASELCESLIGTWVELHDVDVSVDELSWLNKGEGYVGRQIAGWSRRYRDARTPDAADYEGVMAWLTDNQPGDTDQCLVHNDFRFDNLVLDRSDLGEVVGVLDWELATVGDPLMDLGAGLAYWVEADDERGFHMLRLQPTHLPGMYTRKEIIRRYCEMSGRAMDDFRFYEVYGLFRLAGIAQQIYYRYYHGQFAEERFAKFIEVVNYLEGRCQQIIEGK